ncbi:MAG: ShlB/FhaC/HecB family hemolysin secretion/activation protein [Gammaproteobacteria bacterium]|nr:ShlB/FhaC/HecB family hemolysin secretion/activation protein [Gammaproteobacteria bacterium]
MQYNKLFLISIIASLNSPVVFAADPVLPLQRPAERKLQSVDDGKTIQPTIKLPPIKNFSKDRLSAKMMVYLKKVQFEGNTVISNAELQKYTSPYLDRKITADELQSLRRAVTQLYIDSGYINSGAVIPDQAVKNGVITIKIIEGTLNKIQVSGNDWLRTAYLQDRIRLGNEEILNVHVLKEKLFILQQDPRIKQLHAKLSPGAKPGESVLQVRIVEDDAFQVYIGADNHNSPSVGENRGELTLLHNNLTGNGDTLTGHYVESKGLKSYDLSYEIPVMADDSRFKFSYAQGESKIVEEPFDQLDIKNRSRTSLVAFIRPYYRTPDAVYEYSLQGETRESHTYLGGEPFSFTPSSEDGKTRLTVARLVHNWLHRFQNRLLTARSTLSEGLNARDSTISDKEPDGRFTAWLGQGQWVERWPQSKHEVVLRGAMQLTEDHLLSMEQFSIGGAKSVRGYRENYVVGDNGVTASFEYRIPLFGATPDYGQFQLAGFTDYGAVWNKQGFEDPEAEEIYSVGLGLRWTNKKQARFELYWASPVHNKSTQGGSLQDDGVHFRFEARLF